MNTSYNITSQFTKTKFEPHIYLESLIREKFGVFLEIHHDRFDTPVKNYRDKFIIARTMVAAYKSKEDAIQAHKNKGSITPIVTTISECSVGDSFIKKVGLAKALHRMYRDLASKSKTEVHANLV